MPDATAPEADANSIPFNDKSEYCIVISATIITNGRVRRKLNAVSDNGSVELLPLRVYTPHAIPDMDISKNPRIDGVVIPGKVKYTNQKKESINPVHSDICSLLPENKVSMTIVVWTEPNKMRAPVAVSNVT